MGLRLNIKKDHFIGNWFFHIQGRSASMSPKRGSAVLPNAVDWKSEIAIGSSPIHVPRHRTREGLPRRSTHHRQCRSADATVPGAELVDGSPRDPLAADPHWMRQGAFAGNRTFVRGTSGDATLDDGHEPGGRKEVAPGAMSDLPRGSSTGALHPSALAGDRRCDGREVPTGYDPIDPRARLDPRRGFRPGGFDGRAMTEIVENEN